MKTCRGCNKTKPSSDFHKNRSSKDGLQARCKDCHTTYRLNWTDEQKKAHLERTAAWNRRNPKRRKEIQRKAMLRHLYGITEEEYDLRLNAQDHGCAICASRGKEGERYPLSVDHDHDTGIVRGLLCAACNLALGGFRDDPELLRSAVSYLREQKAVKAA